MLSKICSRALAEFALGTPRNLLLALGGPRAENFKKPYVFNGFFKTFPFALVAEFALGTPRNLLLALGRPRTENAKKPVILLGFFKFSLWRSA